jgi:hypothetical protein
MSCHGVLARNLDLHPFPFGIGSIVAMVIGFLLVDTTFTRLIELVLISNQKKPESVSRPK